jgi:hypothetical protein
MCEITHEQIMALDGTINDICYAFYRCEFTNGLKQFDEMISQLTLIMSQAEQHDEKLQDINQLLEMVMMAVENRDFLIAADLLKYELLERIHQVSSSSLKRRLV